MTCPKHAELSAYLDDVLPQGERERLAGHLANCPVCHGYLDQLGALQQTLKMLPSPALAACRT